MWVSRSNSKRSFRRGGIGNGWRSDQYFISGSRLSGSVDGFKEVLANGRVSPIDIPIYLGKRNDAVQKHRGIYSRSSKSAEEVTQKNKLLVKSILAVGNGFVDKNFTLEELCAKTIDKFDERVDRYGKPIEISEYIRNIPDSPKPWIQFKDITPLLQDPRAFKYTVQRLSELSKNADVIVGLDARGFLFGAAVAERLWKPFVPVRKKWKLPYTTIEKIATHSSTVKRHKQCILMLFSQDKKSPSSTISWLQEEQLGSAYNLVEKLGGIVEGTYFVVELDELDGREKLKGKIESLVHY